MLLLREHRQLLVQLLGRPLFGLVELAFNIADDAPEGPLLLLGQSLVVLHALPDLVEVNLDFVHAGVLLDHALVGGDHLVYLVDLGLVVHEVRRLLQEAGHAEEAVVVAEGLGTDRFHGLRGVAEAFEGHC